jgi:aminoglycoside phosphotransferase (APT) family kinase protein
VVVQHVGNTLDRVAEAFGSPDHWEPLPGRDPGSSAFRAGDAVVKTRVVPAFEAENLGQTLDAVHGRLSPLQLVPRIRWQCYDGETLASIFDHIPHSGRTADAVEVGETLARAHQALAGIDVRTGEMWAGFYGEYHEFAMTTAAVADDELRELGLQLLPYARRAEVPGPYHYVHRDLHPGNVIYAEQGLCLVDWDLAHAGSAVDDLAMTALLWAADSSGPPHRIAADVLIGYSTIAGKRYMLGDPDVRPAIALAGLRQGIAAWYTDQGNCSAAYWPFVRRRSRIAVELMTAAFETPSADCHVGDIAY